MKKFTYISPIVSIIFFSLIFRLIAGLYFADTDLKNEWALLIHNFNIRYTSLIQSSISLLAIEIFLGRNLF